MKAGLSGLQREVVMAIEKREYNAPIADLYRLFHRSA